MLGYDMTYFRNIGAVLNHLNVLAGVEHRDPVRGGDDQGIRMVIGYQFYL